MGRRSRIRRTYLGLALIGPAVGLWPLEAPAAPLALDLPQPASQTAAPAVETGTLLLPSGPWAQGQIPGTTLDGRISRAAWRIDQPLATLDLMARLRADVTAAGFQLMLDCATEACGGFDFRYALPVLPEPDMHVDLGDFRFLAGRRGDEGVTLLVSRSPMAAFVQITLVGPQTSPATLSQPVAQPEPAKPDLPAGTAPNAEAPALSLPDLLSAQGHAALDDLAFAPGKSGLETGVYASLSALADWLRAHPDRTVVLVGHTDATGSLQANVAISRARAQSVRAALVGLGVPSGQVAAEGVGYLAPRATNLTDEGRAQNRRVEVVLTSTQ